MRDTPPAPRSSRELPLLLSALLLLPWLVTWPMLPRFFTHVMAAPDQEAAPHIWGLWAGGSEQGLLRLHSTLQAFPDGIELVLVDPLNLLPFHLGLLGGVASAYNLVLLTGVCTMGLAGAALARVAGGSVVIGAVVGMACPTLLANAADGMTEGFGVGLVGLALAALLRSLQAPRSRWWLAGGVLVGLTAWSGPYNAVWTALIGLALAGAAAVRRDAASVAVLARAGGLGAAIAAPVVAAIFGARSEALPGGSDRAGMPDIVENSSIFRGGVRTGADLLDPWLPGPITGGEAEVSHTAYLGVVVLVGALAAVLRAPRARWPWLAGALAFTALSFGPWLYLGGSTLRIGEASLAGPAGLLMLAMPVFSRLTRWYRAGAVATLFLAPLVACTGRRLRPAAGTLLVVAIVTDTLLLAPLAWPLHHTALPEGDALRDLPAGAMVELPPVTSATPPPGAWRDETALLQVLHGHPVGGAMMGLGVSSAARTGVDELRRLLRGEGFAGSVAEELRGAGFRWIVIHTDFHPLPTTSVRHLQSCLGDPVVSTDHYRAWDLGHIPPDASCPPATAPLQTGSAEL